MMINPYFLVFDSINGKRKVSRYPFGSSHFNFLLFVVEFQLIRHNRFSFYEPLIKVMIS